ncbi:MAG: hypothetical protein D6729_09455 [Deltaproteobacteria bacterium]|nr:MAG: hypothetical protein D6729_09455 [Deltaproteobacteria bacterium]
MREPERQQPASGEDLGPATVGLGGCLVGFLLGGLVLTGGWLLLEATGLVGGARTLGEILVMGLGLGATLFVWRVAATADLMARSQGRGEEAPRGGTRASGDEATRPAEAEAADEEAEAGAPIPPEH